MIPSMTKQQ